MLMKRALQLGRQQQQQKRCRSIPSVPTSESDGATPPALIATLLVLVCYEACANNLESLLHESRQVATWIIFIATLGSNQVLVLPPFPVHLHDGSIRHFAE